MKKLLNRKQKGFTIVELVIVIAVIGILAGVLIPVFINLNNKANKAADEALVKNLNTALATQEQEPGDTKNATFHDAVVDLKEYGYLLPNLVAKSDEALLWDRETNRFLLEEDAESDKTLDYWRIQNNLDEQKYNVYAGPKFNATSVTNLKVGFDAGDYEGLTSVSYVGNGVSAQNVVIRTNGGSLTINAASDTVSHYGEGLFLDIQAIAGLSFHEFGHFPKATIAQGRMVVEDKGQVEILNVTGPGVVLDEVGTGSVELCYASSSDNVPTGTASVEVTVATIELDNIVARTENGAYSTLSDALNNLGTSKTLYIVADFNETFTSTGNEAMYDIRNELTINGQGHTINTTFVVNDSNTKEFIEANANITIKDVNITGVGVKYILVAGADMVLENVNITADNAGISASEGHAIARNCTFRFVKGEHTRNDHQEAWAPVSSQYGGKVELFNCVLHSSDGYGLLVWPSGGTLEATGCSITSAKGYAVSWARNGAGTSTRSDSIVRVNNCTLEGSTSCEAKYNGTSAGGTEAYIYKDGVLVATTVSE